MEIVIDFDGTLALGDTTNISLMLPNIKLIEHTNKMYADGNVIKIVTARGSKSCKTYQERHIKYSAIIKDWLEKYNVKYTVLSFYKEYGDIYIDDRCFNVKDNIVYNNLNSPFTDNNVKRFNNKVFKLSDSESIEGEVAWFNHAKKLGVCTPDILTYDVNTISMTYHEPVQSYTRDINKLIQTLTTFKNNKPLNNALIDTYKQRIQNYITNNNIINKSKFLDKVSNINIPNTFNHGDFSTKNILQKHDGVFFIDPIFRFNLYQSYQIDIAKYLFTVLFFEKDYHLYELSRSQFTLAFKIDKHQLDILIACESLRVANRRKQLLDIVNNLVDNL